MIAAGAAGAFNGRPRNERASTGSPATASCQPSCGSVVDAAPATLSDLARAAAPACSRGSRHGIPLAGHRGPLAGHIDQTEHSMLRWALIFAIVALIAGALGFTGIEAGAADIARLLFYVFVALVVIFLILGFTIFKR